MKTSWNHCHIENPAHACVPGLEPLVFNSRISYFLSLNNNKNLGHWFCCGRWDPFWLRPHSRSHRAPPPTGCPEHMPGTRCTDHEGPAHTCATMPFLMHAPESVSHPAVSQSQGWWWFWIRVDTYCVNILCHLYHGKNVILTHAFEFSDMWVKASSSIAQKDQFSTSKEVLGI